MAEAYAEIEKCRRKLLEYSFTSEEARKEVWAAEEELYALEEDLLKASEEPHEPDPV
jgi:hypothetical protein